MICTVSLSHSQKEKAPGPCQFVVFNIFGNLIYSSPVLWSTSAGPGVFISVCFSFLVDISRSPRFDSFCRLLRQSDLLKSEVQSVHED